MIHAAWLFTLFEGQKDTEAGNWICMYPGRSKNVRAEVEVNKRKQDTFPET